MAVARCCGCAVVGIILGVLIVPVVALLVLEFTDCDLFDTD